MANSPSPLPTLRHTRHQAAVLLGAVAILACASASKHEVAQATAGPTSVPAYPQPGFGRAGCFAGGTLKRRSQGTVLDRDTSRLLGPWLVLDSLTREEFMRGGTPPERVREAFFRMGSLVESREQGDWSVGGFWTRPAPDSLVFNDAFFPGATYRMKVSDVGLEGEAVMVSDVVRDGRRLVTRWPVRIWRVSCGAVPLRYGHGQDTLMVESTVIRAMIAKESLAAATLDSMYSEPDQAPPTQRLGRREPYAQEMVTNALRESLGNAAGDSVHVRTSKPVIRGDTATVSVTVYRFSPRRPGRSHYETVPFTLVRVNGLWIVRKRVVLGVS